MNYGVYLGVGPLSEDWDDDYYKLQIAAHLPKDWKVFAFSRVDVPKEKIPPNVNYFRIDKKPFIKKYSKKQREEIEQWLGYPVALIASHNKILHHMPREKVEAEYADIICSYVELWKRLFTESRIDAFSSTMESALHEVVSLLVAKRMGINVLNFSRGRLDYNTFILIDKDFDLIFWKKLDTGKIRELYEKEAARLSARNAPAGSELGRIVSRKRRLSIGKLLNYAKSTLIYFTLPKDEKLRVHSPFSKIARFVQISLNRLLNSLLYDKPVPGKKFVLYPFHYQDEAILYFKEPFADQFEIIRSMSRVLPLDTWIYVKMHPHYSGGDVEFGKLLELKRLGNVKIIRPGEDTKRLIAGCSFLATINSTSGFEAVLLNKPVLAFGHGLYCRKGISTIVKDMNELSRLIPAMILGPDEFVDSKQRRKFIANVSYNTIPISTELKTVVELSDEDAGKIAKQLVAAIGAKRTE